MSDFKTYRDAAGKFLGSFAGAAPDGAIECSLPDHAMQKWQGGTWVDTVELIKMNAEKDLEKSDQEMARLVEDILQVLIAKGVMTETDLPAEAQAKLAARRENRGKMK